MSKIYGIGETVYDIIFRDGQPQTAVPGGSAFNAIISLGRCGVHPVMTTAIGDDHIGRLTLRFMEENGVDTSAVSVNRGCRSHLSLAFLNERNDAEYQFYKDPAHDRVDAACPRFHAADIVLFGSFFAVNPVLRTFTRTFLSEAHAAASILYYDVNFRASHQQEVIKITPYLLENLELAHVVRGSVDDFEVLFKKKDADAIYRSDVAFYSKKFICTNGAQPVQLRAENALRKEYPVIKTSTVSTIGAGDNFNAGFVYGLIKSEVSREMMEQALPETLWDQLIAHAQQFSANCCQSIDNSIDKAFGLKLQQQ